MEVRIEENNVGDLMKARVKYHLTTVLTPSYLNKMNFTLKW